MQLSEKTKFKCIIILLVSGCLLMAISFVAFFLAQYLVEKSLVDVNEKKLKNFPL